MIVKVQTCWNGHGFLFRALVCGGLLIRSDDGKWSRRTATAMLDLLEIEGFDRSRIRFRHV